MLQSDLKAERFSPGMGTKNKVAKIHKESGDIIEIYGSAREASRKTGICNNSISKCCRAKVEKGKKLPSAGGYYWKYVIQNMEEQKKEPKIKGIFKIDPLHFNILARYDTITEASKDTGISQPNITSCILHPSKHKTAGGYIWKRV